MLNACRPLQPRLLNKWQMFAALLLAWGGAFMGAVQGQAALVEKWWVRAGGVGDFVLVLCVGGGGGGGGQADSIGGHCCWKKLRLIGYTWPQPSTATTTTHHHYRHHHHHHHTACAATATVPQHDQTWRVTQSQVQT
jgi:hypothetical protein